MYLPNNESSDLFSCLFTSTLVTPNRVEWDCTWVYCMCSDVMLISNHFPKLKADIA